MRDLIRVMAVLFVALPAASAAQGQTLTIQTAEKAVMLTLTDLAAMRLSKLTVHEGDAREYETVVAAPGAK